MRWTAPDECPADAFTGALDRLLIGSSLDAPLRVRATVERTAEGWSIDTAFDAGPGRTGQRTFQALTCRTVAQAAALAIAIAVDPSVLDRWVPAGPAETIEGEAGPQQTSPTPVAVPVAPAAASPADPRRPGPEGPTLAPRAIEPSAPLGPIEAATPTAGDEPRDPSSRWRGLLGVAGAVDGGALPGPGLGLAATLGVLHRRVRGEVVGTRRFATQQAATADPQVGGSFTQWSVGARGCGVPRLRAVELPLCLGVEGGRTVGRGIGVPAPRTSPQPWWAGLVEAGLAWPVRPWLALTARATLAVPVLRQEFSITGLGVVHRVGAIQGRGALGVELRWP